MMRHLTIPALLLIIGVLMGLLLAEWRETGESRPVPAPEATTPPFSPPADAPEGHGKVVTAPCDAPKEDEEEPSPKAAEWEPQVTVLYGHLARRIAGTSPSELRNILDTEEKLRFFEKRMDQIVGRRSRAGDRTTQQALREMKERKQKGLYTVVRVEELADLVREPDEYRIEMGQGPTGIYHVYRWFPGDSPELDRLITEERAVIAETDEEIRQLISRLRAMGSDRK